ncbi:MAG: hypothetical protein ABDH28_02650 [Brevinematia bacterium]
MDLREQLVDLLKFSFPQDQLERIVDAIETFSPIPKNTFDSLRTLILNHRDKEEEIVGVLSRGDLLELISKVLGYSIYLRNIINEKIELLFFLQESISTPFDEEGVRKEVEEVVREFSDDKNSFLSKLRDIRKREFLKIVSREMVGLSSFEETSKELSLLADIMIEGVLKFNTLELSREMGEPSSEFCVISLGKLGGLELNYSSDVDIMFVYERDGKTSKGVENSEFFDKLARNIVYEMSSSVKGEFLYRVDTRLRPDGEFGALVKREEGYYDYYTERGQTWEIQMLIKTRCSAGSLTLGKRFVDNIREIVYSTPLTDSEIAEILGIKQKIRGTEYDLKKSTGGIRDIEFIVQLLQLIFGTKEKALRLQNTLLALDKLEKIKVIDGEMKRVLEYGYRTLRRLENYIQLYANLQDFSLPINDTNRMIGLFRLLQTKYSKISGDEDRYLLHLVNDIRREVIKVKGYIFEKLLDVRAGEEVIFFLYNSEEKEVRDLLFSYGIKETARAFSFLESMISFSFRGGVETSIGLRNLLRAVSLSPMPDKSLSNIYYVLEATQNLPISIQFFTDERNVNFIFNVSLLKDAFISILRKRNWIWDGMMDTNAFMDYLPVFLNKIDFSRESWVEIVREVYEVVVTSLAFLRINKFINANRTKELFARLYDKIFLEFSKVLGGNLCVLSLGRWANRKLTFFSDVDLVYILPYSPYSDEFFDVRDGILKIHNELGSIFEIDTRLVEGSHKGSFIISLKTLEESSFDIWQTIAYLKSRPISSSETFERKVGEVIVYKLRDAIRNLDFSEFNNFVKRVIANFERVDDLKKGRGNILELELVLDKLYFKHFREFDEVPVAKSLSEMERMLENVVKLEVPLRDYLALLVEVEDVTRIVEGIGFDDKVFDIAKIPVKFSEFQKLRGEVISWCDKVINLD